MLVRYRDSQRAMMNAASAPEQFVPDAAAARAVIEGALASGREWLVEPEAKEILPLPDPVAATRTVADAEAESAAADRISGRGQDPLARPHAQVRCRRRCPRPRGRRAGPGRGRRCAGGSQAAPRARIEGFVVQPMIRRPNAHELIVGASEDPQFGLVILFGHGGTAVEVIADRALALPPLNMHLAHDLMAQTRVSRLLRRYRGRPSADLDAIAVTLIKVAQRFAEIADSDINPPLRTRTA